MSHNYTGWTTKKIEGFQISLSDIMKSQDADQEISVKASDGKVKMFSWGDEILRGTIDENNIITVEEFGMTGEGSGGVVDLILIPALKYSTGKYEALVVWEGHEVMILTVEDGKSKWTSV